MSRFNIEKIACPRCGKDSDFRVWSSINTALDPEMKKQVRTREAFKFVCPFCGADANVDYGFLYHQMEDQIIIHYAQGEESFNDAYNMLSGNDERLTGNLGLNLFEGYTKRVVASQNQLLEKLAIFDAGLDDRIVEIIKVIFWAQMQESHKDISVDEIFYYTEQDGSYGIQFMNEGQGVATASFDKEMYQEIVDEFNSKIQDALEDDIVIDTDWALQKMK